MEKNQFEDRDDVGMETLSDDELDLVAGGTETGCSGAGICTGPCCNPIPAPKPCYS